MQTPTELRDSFAREVIAAMLSNSTINYTIGVNHKETNLLFAQTAYAYADAMMLAREQPMKG